MGYFDDFSRSQYVIPATDLGDMIGGTISSIKFYTTSSNVPYTSVSTVDVYIMEVSYTSISAFEPKTNDAIVYQGTLDVVTEGEGGSLTIEFSTPYTYGGGNLLVAIENTTDAGYKFIYFYGQTVTGASISGSNGSSLANVSPSQRNFIPKTTFTYTPGAAPSCQKPTNLEVSNVSSTNASFSWTKGGDETEWVLEYSTASNFTNAVSVPRSGIPAIAINDFNPGTTYYAHVKAVCGDDDESTWSNVVSFTTECGAITSFPWTENFENYAAGNFNHPCWVNEHISGSGTYIFSVYTSTTGTNSTHQLRLPDQSDGTLTKLRLPEMTLPGNDYQFTIDVYRSSGYSNKTGEGVRVYVSTDGEIEGATELAFIPRYYEVASDVIPAENTGDKWYTYSLPIGISGTCYIILRGENQYGASTYMDNFIVEQIPSCPKPQNLAVTNNSVTAHGATVTWAETGEATTWVVEYATNADFTAASTETVDDEPTYTFEGLDPETTYYVRVKAHCGEGNDSQYSNTVNFTTDAACKVPTGLTVTNLTATTATLSWTENGESASWQICLNNDEENLINANTNPYTLEGLTAETVYTAKVRGICNGEPTGWSSSVSFEPTAKLVIGSGTSTTGYLPTNTNYDFSYTQQIYTVAELGEAGVIESIDFYMTSTSDYDRDLDIYMVSTDKSSFTGNTDWIAVTDADLVFSGNVNFTADSWTTITLDEGFIYDGTKNVAIIVDDNSDKWNSRYFLSFAVESNQAHYCYQDDTNIDPNSPSATYNSVSTSRNQIRILKTELSNCMKPTQFAATEVGPDFAVLSWTENGASEAWVIDYNGATVNVTENPYTLEGLANVTPYTVKVRPTCDENLWSSEISFTTLEGCPAPENVEVSNITHTSANVSWTGYSDSYNIMLGEPTYLVNANFENNQIPASFTNDATYPWTVVENNHSGAYCAKSATGNNSQTSALELEVTLTSDLTLTFSAKVSSEANYDMAYFSIDGVDKINGISGAGNWIDYSYPLTAGTHTLRWYYTKDSSVASNDDCFYVDDIQIIDGATVLGNYTSSTNNYTLSDLTPGTIYVVQVQGVCGDQTSEWSETVSFTAPAYKHFVTEGEWNVASNWEPAGLPEEGDDVFIEAAATIPAGYVANVGHITNNGTITIKDGGQLRHTNGFSDDVTVTLEKEITGYGESTERDHYYFIAPAPFTQTLMPADVENLINEDGTYDLYSFSASSDLEWINQKSSDNFKLRSAHGYLYANKQNVTLKATGPAIASTSGGASIQVNYDPNAGYSFNGWRLAGNPYVCNGYVYFVDNNNQVLETEFYRMNVDGDGYELITSADALSPFEGVFIYTENSGHINFAVDPITSNSGKLNMNLTRNGKRIDMARVRFGQGQNFGKMSFRENSSKIYMPVDGKDYATVFSTEAMGELPVCFKAETNGSYTLSFTNEEVSFGYLHLIDNLTGIDTDLLANPSYSFEAKTTDYANRFKLVFATGNADDNFAFFSNGSFVINNEGNATLQVVDVTGRIIKSESINGCANVNVNAAPGVYMIRLVNGDNVKVQKVVVR